ncbi:MAG: cyclodeaminase/cyclohydrolase family protein [Candidatus Scalindua sp.]|nr:cyclodeaminase/cyclohydrolase family protein [Candidatus Scalindua sp.]
MINRIKTAGERGTIILADLTIIEFLEKLGSGFPVPGGGSVAALSAALAASLTEMVANLTTGKKGYEAVEEEMKIAAQDAIRFKQKFVLAIDDDSNAYSSVVSAMKLPGVTEAEKRHREITIQNGLKQAVLIPMTVAREAAKLMELAEKVVSKGNKNTITDGAVSFIMARTAVISALYNVKINLASIHDSAFVDKILKQVKDLEIKVDKEKKEVV